MSLLSKIKQVFSKPEKTISEKAAMLKSWSNLWLRSLESQLTGDTVQEPYKEHQTVYMAVDAIGTSMSTVNLKFYKKKGDSEVTEHRIIDLFTTPNELMCRYQLWEATVIYYSLHGEAFWLLDKSLGQEVGTSKIPARIRVINPKEVLEVINSKKELVGWKWNNQTYSLEEIIFFRKFNPYKYLRGFSPVDPIKRTLNLDNKSMLYNDAFFNNSAELGGILSTDKELTDAQFNRILKQMEARHKGVNKAKRLALLESGLKYESTASNHKDMEFLEQRRFNREEILGIWRAPKSMFSITDDLNYATGIAQKKLFWQNTIKPILTYLQENLNSQFFPKVAPELYCEFDLSAVPELQEDFAALAETAFKLFQMGFTGNEVNERLNLGFEEKEWRNQWWIPFSMIPAGTETSPSSSEEPKALARSEEKLGKILEGLKVQKDVEKRRLTWEIFDMSIRIPENRMQGALVKYFNRMEKVALAELEKSFEEIKSKGLGDLKNMNWQKFNDELKRAAIPFIMDASKIGMNNANRAVGGIINFELLNPQVISFVQDRENKIVRVNDTVKGLIDQEIIYGIKNGLSVQEISEGIRKVFKTSRDRALTIARTEVVAASNGAELISYKEAGVKRKEWLTARDEAVRESHQKLDGVKVDLNKNFPNGLPHPGGEGAPEEVINCRCALVPVIE